jgi:hypothetical protein
MALPWLLALKLVPWAKVIEAAPQIAKHAKKLFAGSRATAPTVPQPELPVPRDPAALAALVSQLQGRIAALEAERQATAGVLAELAEQQAQLVAMADVLRRRARHQAIALALMGAVAVAALLLAWRA